MPDKLLPATLVGSYPQPGWLIDRARLSKMVPRVRKDYLWRPDPQELEARQHEATLLAICDQERAGLDIITDGEQRRESYCNRFVSALAGVDSEYPGTTVNRTGKPIAVPRVTGRVMRKHPVMMHDLQLLRAHTAKLVKMTVPGPFTISKQTQNQFYASDAVMAIDYAAAVNMEVRNLFAAGVDIVQTTGPGCSSIPTPPVPMGWLHSTARSTASPAPSPCICVSAMPRFGYAAVVHEKPVGYSFLSERSRAAQISIEAAQPKFDLAVLDRLPSKIIVLGVIDLVDSVVETAQRVGAHPRGARVCAG